ncbi:DUF211 domain-containing protein [Candidatus Borrarchaeum sp.]|uniref:DUF211 domain-containing protein n=1 Tax=Candidatus Borrarchaeum sp. TaxID=2846742 RepID=UPI0025808258|nr:DUF211 domain-containing protein [Candidatus Borrarchaeum sp.]
MSESTKERGLKRLVLDVLKPHMPLLPELSVELSRLSGVAGVNISLIEVDKNTESVKITIEGNSLDYELIAKSLEESGAVIHSIDQTVAGKVIIEEVETHES